MTVFLVDLVLVALQATEQSPEPEDVKAGWTAFAVFVLLIAAVAFLGFSLSKHLRKAKANEEAGVFGSEADDGAAADAEPERHQAP